MDIKEHIAIASTALRGWFVAQAYDAVAVGALWLIGLLLIQVPLAPLWAVLGAILQFIPYIGTLLALGGPAVAGAISGGLERLIYVLILYAVISIADAFVLQPYMVKRMVRVPVWVSILTPLVLGTVLSFWGVLLSIPLLAVIYTYRARYRRNSG
ncbi:MAG: AI-2E family transporter [Acidobacteria bacterium]|nr:AI-2E family transporter [Acidobacteriota bacterium]